MAQGGEKTEKPTWKRLREARRKGQVAKSRDLTSALLLVASVVVLGIVGRATALQLSAAFRQGILDAVSFKGELDLHSALAFILAGVLAVGWALAPLLSALFFGALLVSYLQVGSVFSFEALTPNLSRLDPASNFQQKFLSSRPYLELIKTLLKLSITAAVILLVLWSVRADVVRLLSQPIQATAFFTASLIFEIGLKVGLAFLLIGAADFFLQRFLHLKDLKMTKQEVKEDYKESHGNPIYKTARRQMHRQILAQSMAAVKTAAVVVVNPTHVAVALKYDRETMNAPSVVAKGAELIAAQIRELARESKVPIAEDVALARALYELEVEDEIPETLYEAVAEVLRWVYSLAREREG